LHYQSTVSEERRGLIPCSSVPYINSLQRDSRSFASYFSIRSDSILWYWTQTLLTLRRIICQGSRGDINDSHISLGIAICQRPRPELRFLNSPAVQHFQCGLGQTIKMYFSFLLPFAPLILAAPLQQSQSLFISSSDPASIPTIHESAVLARRILHLTNIGTLSTIFPSSKESSFTPQGNQPSSVSSTPIGLMDYIADCETPSNNPTVLAISIATSFKNVAAGSNISLSLRWHPPHPPSSDPFFSSPAAMPRFSLVGYLEEISDEDVQKQEVAQCFTKSHPDARAWLPGNRIHQSKWTRLVVEEVYWIGGFGDRAYIGWIPLGEWDSVKESEWRIARLPGEVESSIKL
jgi:hypothetical protein